MTRLYNFSSGPATLPTEVLLQVKEELLDWHNCGASVMEISHRGEAFLEIVNQTERDFRELLKIPNNYKILFLQGGARLQFAMIPMNLLRGKNTADYIETGIWSTTALKQAQQYCEVNIVASSEAQSYTTIPEISEWRLNNQAAYFHYVDNETINGVEFPYIPQVKVPLVSDMSSNILSREFDITKFGLVYAGAQKNIGPAGLTVVIVRDDLIGNVLPFTPIYLNYQTHVDANSLYNTPTTFAWYICGLVLQWLKRRGGVKAMEKINRLKAKKLYDFIDQSEFFYNDVEPKYRSRMNVVFRLKDEKLDDRFLKEAKSAGLIGLKGHKLLGGMRASLYNAMPEEGVDALIAFMHAFAGHYSR